MVHENFQLHRNYMSDETIQGVKDAWTEAIGRFQAASGLAEVAVTFQPCCRSASYQPDWYLEKDIGEFTIRRAPPDHRSRIRCVELENHFSDLLAGSNCIRRADTVTFLGNVPPSLAVRLAQPYPGCGLSFKAIGKMMAEFISKTEANRDEWERRAGEGRDVD